MCSEKPGDIVGIAFILGIKIERFADACEFGRSKVYKEDWGAERGWVPSHAGKYSAVLSIETSWFLNLRHPETPPIRKL